MCSFLFPSDSPGLVTLSYLAYYLHTSQSRSSTLAQLITSAHHLSLMWFYVLSFSLIKIQYLQPCLSSPIYLHLPSPHLAPSAPSFSLFVIYLYLSTTRCCLQLHPIHSPHFSGNQPPPLPVQSVASPGLAPSLLLYSDYHPFTLSLLLQHNDPKHCPSLYLHRYCFTSWVPPAIYHLQIIHLFHVSYVYNLFLMLVRFSIKYVSSLSLNSSFLSPRKGREIHVVSFPKSWTQFNISYLYPDAWPGELPWPKVYSQKMLCQKSSLKEW